MIRVTSGILKGRRFDVVGEAVRPTMESVREAIFSSLEEPARACGCSICMPVRARWAWKRGVEGPARSFLWKRISEQLNSSRTVLLYLGVMN